MVWDGKERGAGKDLGNELVKANLSWRVGHD